MTKVKLRNEPEKTGDFSIDRCRSTYRVLMESNNLQVCEHAADLMAVSKYKHPDDITDRADADRMVHLFRLIAKAYNIET
ncbi:TPA: hypothetical protein ACH2I9_004560 [Enterobacter asburiae]